MGTMREGLVRPLAWGRERPRRMGQLEARSAEEGARRQQAWRGNEGRVPTSRLQQSQRALVQRRGLGVLAVAETLVAGSAELFHRV